MSKLTQRMSAIHSSFPHDPFHWPVLKRYDGEYLRRIALPVGGIGTGTISLGGRGDWRDWEIANNPAKGFSPRQTFFAIRTQAGDKSTFTRALEGPIAVQDYEGAMGCAVANHGLPRFRTVSFETAYPFGQVLLSDPDAPVSIRLQAFNPFIPDDADASGFPIAALRFVVTNKTDENIKTSICGNLENFIGENSATHKFRNNWNEYRQGGGCYGVFGRSEGVPTDAPEWGTLALAVIEENDLQITHRTSWAKHSWGDSLLDFWDDFSSDGEVQERDREDQNTPIASLCAQWEMVPHATRAVTFLIGWHFPTRMSWTPGAAPPVIGNYYTTHFSNAWDAIEKFAAQLPQLEERSLAFVRSFCDSDFPDVVKEAALFNLSTLRSPTVFRTPDGKMFGWEGVLDRAGSCVGSCTHVWNYEQATAFLFPALARSMREVEFLHATNENGKMSFRVGLPLETQARQWPLAAADGQMGCLMKLYRDWQLCGDDVWLKKLWPQAKRALEFCWVTGGWDGDTDGVMEGCQHNTMDVEYFGPNPQMQGWYLGALRACEEMARYCGDEKFAVRCRELFEYGSKWMDDSLFNGEYYEHEIRPIAHENEIADDLRHKNMGTRDLGNPELQLGAGCLADQMVGQYFAHICGLGYLHDPEKVRSTLASVMRHNFKNDLNDHFNHMRSFALADESALLMTTYPRGNRPERPLPYYNEAMTGFEYTTAIGLAQEGNTSAGLKLIESIRSRYNGQKRNPFNEAECGYHYARAMASWGAIMAFSGFQYSAVAQTMKFKCVAKKSKWFWSTGAAWGIITLTPRHKNTKFGLRVEQGILPLRSLHLGKDTFERNSDAPLMAGQEWENA